MLVVLLVALAARVWRLGDANLWWDEALAVWAVRKGLVGATLWTAGDVHPPLYFWCLWVWVRLFGESALAMRMLSAAAGVLTVAVAQRWGAWLGGRRAGLLAALLVALARFHVWWSQEMRMYVLAGLLSLASLALFWRWLAEREADAPAASHPARRSSLLLAAYVLASAGALYTVFLSGVALLAENLVVLIALVRPGGARPRRLILPWAAAQAAIALLLGAWLALSWGRMPSWSAAAPVSLGAVAQLYAVLLATGISVEIQRHWLAALLPLVVLALGGALALAEWRRRGARPRHQVLGALALALTVALGGLLVFVATRPRGLFYVPRLEARYLLPFAPPFYVLLAVALNALWRRWRLAGWAAAAAVLGLWLAVLPGHYADRHMRDDLPSLVRAILSQAEPGDVVLLDSGSRYPLFLYPYERLSPGTWRPPVRTVSVRDERLTEDEVARALTALAAEHGRIWLAEVDVNLSDPDRLVRGWLEAHSRRVQALAYGHNTLLLFDPSGRAPALAVGDYAPEHVVETNLDPEGQLWAWELPARTVAPGDIAHLALLWAQVPAEEVAIALVSSSGQTVLRRRAAPPPPGARVRQQFDLSIGPGLPAGRY
ncbi:MAG: glycosyltransferase family 39 protein, partial [Chloroflexota bacterium]